MKNYIYIYAVQCRHYFSSAYAAKFINFFNCKGGGAESWGGIIIPLSKWIFIFTSLVG